MLKSVLFALLLMAGIGLFLVNIKKLRRNILLGKDVDEKEDKKKRIKRVIKLSLGQQKVVRKPIVGVLHILVYVGFILINIELLEMVVDGLFLSHRFFASMGKIYDFLMACFEFLALGVIIAVVVFYIRRNIIKVGRLNKKELNGFPKKDANLILILEFVMTSLFLVLNASYSVLYNRGVYTTEVYFPISSFLNPMLDQISTKWLLIVEQASWWGHIIGVLFFLNYIYYSKHLHILLAFPYAYHARITPKGQLSNDKSITKEVELMLDPNADPFSAQGQEQTEIGKFGASDATDLSWVQIMSAYTCTECGRCTEVCPANITGKKLSPRKIMMDTRDRIEEIGKKIDKKQDYNQRQLLGDYISEEEIWACTSCNACLEACPIDIDPLSIIMEMRRFLIMEKAKAPALINSMMTNIENNGSPWKFDPSQREDWFRQK